MADNIKAVVYRQFTISWQELGKSAIVAGLTAALSVVYACLEDKRFPVQAEWIEAGRIGAIAMAGAVIKYLFNPTRTIINGIHDPISKVKQPDTVITKEA